ncbi:uncharacterized protein BCR38DRAFT_440592 [Pseudomassariella vexata]|uniref:Uncharacterized protein n=1 Tax=Pseudomassariella vexata TaxID=1141098 RepID=A0A1Y2DR53_9PEZI|nr:uncharacterized protein BCR38DRAFT_440592 [Pseudomassariella vexata]ORY61586.1 hypothetical protein BCR38DRAFT_440592 [Pseudomassariella vexata]
MARFPPRVPCRFIPVEITHDLVLMTCTRKYLESKIEVSHVRHQQPRGAGVSTTRTGDPALRTRRLVNSKNPQELTDLGCRLPSLVFAEYRTVNAGTTRSYFVYEQCTHANKAKRSNGVAYGFQHRYFILITVYSHGTNFINGGPMGIQLTQMQATQSNNPNSSSSSPGEIVGY